LKATEKAKKEKAKTVQKHNGKRKWQANNVSDGENSKRHKDSEAETLHTDYDDDVIEISSCTDDVIDICSDKSSPKRPTSTKVRSTLPLACCFLANYLSG
jgi:hypothetical protein